MSKNKGHEKTDQTLINQRSVKHKTDLARKSEKPLSRIDHPLFCDLIISHKCFFQCKMCIDWKTPSDKKPLTYDRCRQFVDGLSGFVNHRLDINIMGGEPLMLDWVLPLCNYIYKKGFTSIMSTNAYLIDEDMARKIADSHLGVLAISLDGIEAETHDFIRGRQGAYSRVMDAIEYLGKYCKNGPQITILTLILERNLEELSRIVKWAQETEIIDSISFLALLESGLVDKKKGWFKQPEYQQLWPQNSKKTKDAIEALISLKKEGYKIYNPYSQLDAFKEYYNNPERFLRETEYCIHDYIVDLDPTGEIFLSGHSLSSIKDGMNLEKSWFSKKANEIRRYIDLHGCDSSRSCLINFICAFQQDGNEVRGIHYASMGFHYQQEGQHELALLNFKKASEINPDSAELHLGVAYNYLKLKDYKAALHEYKEAFRLNPDSYKDTAFDYKEALEGSKKIDNNQNRKLL